MNVVYYYEKINACKVNFSSIKLSFFKSTGLSGAFLLYSHILKRLQQTWKKLYLTARILVRKTRLFSFFLIFKNQDYDRNEFFPCLF